MEVEKKTIPQCVVDAIETMLLPYGAHLADINTTARRYMTAKQASIYSGISPHTIRERAAEGAFEWIRLGHTSKGRVLIDKYSFDSWLNSFKHRPTSTIQTPTQEA